jgi:hypothetical protein
VASGRTRSRCLSGACVRRFRRDGELARAARIALWLAREYGLAFDNDAAARGWLARAERLLHDVAPGAEQGWLDLARSEGAHDAGDAGRLARSALDVALAARDPDLELRALAQLGLAEVTLGNVDQGLSEQLLVGLEAEPEALQARVAVRLARGEAGAASALLVRRLDELGWTNLLAARPCSPSSWTHWWRRDGSTTPERLPQR